MPPPPTPEAYRALCTAVGWQEIVNLAAAEAALRHGLPAGVVERDGLERQGGPTGMFQLVRRDAVEATG